MIISDWLLILIVPTTAWAAVIKYRTGRKSAFLARLYMLVVFSVAALATLGYVPLDINSRVLLLRCGWFALVFDEVVTWAKIERWPRKYLNRNGPQN